MPGAKLIVAGLNYEQGEYRVLDVRGNSLNGFDQGFTLPIAESFCMHMADNGAPRLCNDASTETVYSATEMYRSWSVQSYVGFPLELSDGSRSAVSARSRPSRDASPRRISS
jgi:hypothetical protein